jgi:hypothetical protein
VKQRDLSTSRLLQGPRHVCGSIAPFAEIDWDEDGCNRKYESGYAAC